MTDSFYTSGDYFLRNPTYDSDVCLFKANNIVKLIKSSGLVNGLDPNSILTIAEIGCGSGLILKHLKLSGIFSHLCSYEGWDISPDAVRLASISNPSLKFYNMNLLQTENHYDLIICADVFEHIGDSFSFMKSLSKHCKYIIFNVPLEINLLTWARGSKPFLEAYEKVGHVHFFTAPSALAFIEICGFKIISKLFAGNRFNLPSSSLPLRSRLISGPQMLLHFVSPLLSSFVFGDSLLVLARAKF